jgi:hypothetical protein
MHPDHSGAKTAPASWVEARDVETFSFEKATWIPLYVAKDDLLHGKSGMVGHRKSARYYDSIIVPLTLRSRFKKSDWQAISRNWPDSAWVDEKGFHPPGCYQGDARIRYAAIQQWFETGETAQWELFQELAVGLHLIRQGDSWLRPEEDGIEVARLERGQQREPELLLIRAEHLRDYLCAKRAALLLVGFEFRDAVEEAFPEVLWDDGHQRREFKTGVWEGAYVPIHEGGQPYEVDIHVVRTWRESVDPNQDVPQMPHPAQESAARGESFTLKSRGRKLMFLSGRIWVKHWILPAEKSPRVREDPVEARVHFHVDNQEQRTLAGAALKDYRGWLWFKPSIVRRILDRKKGVLKWYTEQTGELGIANWTLHFGLNRLGLINVLGYKMAVLPEWAQRIWATDNVVPEGGLSEELHMSQNLAKPASTVAPEEMLWNNLRVLQGRSLKICGQTLLQELPTERDFFQKIHRFYGESFTDVCELSKELHRLISEKVDIGLLNSKIDPGNAVESNQQGLKQIKRLALWLTGLGLNGRDITRPLAGISDLRQGDAHGQGSDLRKSLELFGFSSDEEDWGRVCTIVIGLVSNAVAEIADALAPKDEAPETGS